MRTTIATDTVGTRLTCHAWWDDGTDITVDGHDQARRDTADCDHRPRTPAGRQRLVQQPADRHLQRRRPHLGDRVLYASNVRGAGQPEHLRQRLCRDNAGNQTAASYALKYDATPPALGALSVKAGNRKAQLRWKAPDDASSVTLVRAPGLKGAAESVVFRGTASAKGYTDRGLRPGRDYVYRLTATDAAANVATKTLDFRARGAATQSSPG